MAKANDVISELSKVMQSAIDNGITSAQTSKIGNDLVNDIRIRTRLGFGCSAPGKPRDNLKELSSLYVAVRSGNVFVFKDKQNRIRVADNKEKRGRHPKLSQDTSPSKSNLTFTGQLLNSMHSMVLNPGVFIIDFHGDHRPISPNGKSIPNSTLAYYVEKEGRPFIGPTNREMERIKKTIYDTFKTKIIKSLSTLTKKK